MSEAFFPVDEEGVVVLAEGVGYTGGAVEAFVEKADLVVRHDLIGGAVEEHSGRGRQLVFEAAIIG